MKKKRLPFALAGAVSFAFLLGGSALAQAPTAGAGGNPYEEEISLFAKNYITIAPVLAGPAHDSGEVAPYRGLAFSYGYNFTRRDLVCFGIDARLAFGVPIVRTTESYYDHSGSWIHTSFGFPIRLGGGKVNFIARPGLCIDLLNHTTEGTDTGTGEYWKAEWGSAIGTGLCVDLGLDININERFAIGFKLSFDFLLLPHSGDTEERIGAGPTFYGDIDAYLSLVGLFRFMIKI